MVSCWCRAARLKRLRAALRIRCTRFVVEYPGASGMETTRPPAASTSSRPATWSSGPIRALDENVRQHAGNQFARRGLIENRDVVHRRQCGDHFGAVLLGDQRALGALVSANAAIAVDRHNKHIAEGARVGKAAHVTGMQQIETAVGEYNPAPAALFARRYLS